MTSLLEGARRLITRGSDLGGRIDALQSAAEEARGRLDDELVDQAHEVVERAASRLRLSADHTVVAIAGATGSGKSSTFNSLTGLELSAVGVRRPTTSWATACVWGTEGAQELLDWLGIPPRHQTTRRPVDDLLGLVDHVVVEPAPGRLGRRLQRLDPAAEVRPASDESAGTLEQGRHRLPKACAVFWLVGWVAQPLRD